MFININEIQTSYQEEEQITKFFVPTTNFFYIPTIPRGSSRSSVSGQDMAGSSMAFTVVARGGIVCSM